MATLTKAMLEDLHKGCAAIRLIAQTDDISAADFSAADEIFTLKDTFSINQGEPTVNEIKIDQGDKTILTDVDSAEFNMSGDIPSAAKELFEEIGCAYCHRPSWTTGDDNCYDPNGFFARGDNRLPRYPRQTIWPYSDLIQHKLHMKNDIRTGWCRTTPLWGRGLHQMCTGAVTADRLHDNRARNVIEAIMWHGSPQSDARWSVEAFRNLPKADRDAIVKFIDSI